MNKETLVLPRRLAIEILHAAQIAQPRAIRGVVGGRDGLPVSYRALDEAGGVLLPEGQQLWAQLHSRPLAAAVPAAAELSPGVLHLIVSLNTKGVLELRAWVLQDAQPLERVITITD